MEQGAAHGEGRLEPGRLTSVQQPQEGRPCALLLNQRPRAPWEVTDGVASTAASACEPRKGRTGRRWPQSPRPGAESWGRLRASERR